MCGAQSIDDVLGLLVLAVVSGIIETAAETGLLGALLFGGALLSLPSYAIDFAILAVVALTAALPASAQPAPGNPSAAVASAACASSASDSSISGQTQ